MKNLTVAGFLLIFQAASAFAQIVPIPPPAPSIALSVSNQGLTIEFTGTLQAAESYRGPWNDLPLATSPYQHATTDAPKFFRSRESGTFSIFASPVLADLTITGPLQEHFELAKAGMPDGIFPPIRTKPYFTGQVEYGGAALPVSLRVRGNSSLQECPFPKLKMKIDRTTRVGTPFADAREIKIGTHCAEGGTGPVGRLREQSAVFREILAYETMDLLGFLSPRVRRAQIIYHDTSVRAEGETGWTIMRDGLLMDDAEVVAERLGGRALSDEEKEALRDAQFDPQLVVDLRMFHALLGNWDYTLSADGRETWNADVIELPTLQMVPIAGDFDLSSWVTAKVQRNAPRDYFPDIGEFEREARYRLEQIFNEVGPENYELGKTRFINKREAIEAKILSSNLDEDGRKNALQHLEAFFWALESIIKK